mgnify:CR=1 FL=1
MGLYRVERLKLLESKTIKIPIKDGTTLAALSIVNNAGESFPYKAFRLTDGTVEVELSRKPWDDNSVAKIKAYLAPSDVFQVHGIGGRAPVDVSRLSDEARSRLGAAKEHVDILTGGDLPGAIAIVVGSVHRYSTDKPVNYLEIENAKTDVDVVNAIVKSDICDCDLCTTESALLSGTDVGLGYMFGVDNPASASRDSKFLMGDSRHAYQLTVDGDIIDATPIVTLDAEEGEEAITLDSFGLAENISIWDSLSDDIDDERNLQITAGIIFAAIGYVSGSFAYSKLGKKVSKGKLIGVADSAVLSQYSREDLISALELFSKMSWGGNRNASANFGFDEVVNKLEILDKIRENIFYERLADFFEHPELYTQVDFNTLKQQLLLRYISATSEPNRTRLKGPVILNGGVKQS